jgi:pyruvate,water dikinase
MTDDIARVQELGRTQIATAGGKGAALGELTRIDGVRVPAGFCVTTAAFRRAGTASAVPDAVARSIENELDRLGRTVRYAVRSSATAEDLPTSSFAGQYDSYLDVDADAVVEHVRRCWASLGSRHAMAYRDASGIEPATVAMAVVVQQMVHPLAAGVAFTADPVSGNRTVVSIDAVAGPAEALVCGRVTPDNYTVLGRELVAQTIAADAPVLSPGQILTLTGIARRIESHFGVPQDIEWCLDHDGFAIVQSRPITTLFPVPVAGDEADHVYVSVGHQQMMTDPMRPLGWSTWQALAVTRMFQAGGRLFVDVASHLAVADRRAALVDGFSRADPLTGDALRSIADRGFIAAEEPVDVSPTAPADRAAAPPPLPNDPAIVAELVAQWRVANATAADGLAGRSGVDLLDAIVADVAELQRVMADPRSRQAIMAGMEAAAWLNDHLQEWLGEANAADVLSQSVPGNVTSEMGLALLDVADTIRPHPEIVAFLQQIEGEDFLDDLAALSGGNEARAAIEDYLGRYGMRCVGEIDITRPRWAEQPSLLIPMLVADVANFDPGAGRARFEQGRREAEATARELLARLRALPDGDAKAREAEWNIERVRTFAGYREYPKYAIVSRLFSYRRALMEEAGRLVAAGTIADAQDVFFLTLPELAEVVRTGVADAALVAERRAAFRAYAALTPPRVLTSDGEAVTGAYRRDDLPAGALPGLAVSGGTIEGRARVVHDISGAALEPGDILVTAFTDPSWSPLFLSAAGLVTEVGGLMTHGAVIAREYGLPAVVGVEGATRRLRDGDRIRVHGTGGYVEILG